MPHAKKKEPISIKAEIYLQDPLVAQKYPTIGLKEIELRPEPEIGSGPTSARVVVVDYNADGDKLIPPAPLANNRTHFVVKPESFGFNQVNCWAVIRETLEMFEDQQALGRRIPWGFDGHRIIVLPHAGYWENAFYDRKTRTLQFFYFHVDGKAIYTCLSHDIVSHETGHAILDGIRPLYNELSSPDTAGFHEFMGDLSAILTGFSHKEMLATVIEKSEGDLRNDKIAATLAEEFGSGVYQDANRLFLRNAINNKTMKDLANNWEPHDYSEVLTGAMYEILIRMYEVQWEREKKEVDEKHQKPSKVKALWIAVRHFKRIALRALDYCPPADIQYSEYGRALLRADTIAYPVDRFGYRKIVKDVFLKRGIVEKEEELETIEIPLNTDFNPYTYQSISESAVAAYHFLDENRSFLRIPHPQDFRIVGFYANSKEGDYHYKLPPERIISYMWEEDIPLRGSKFGRLNGRTFPLYVGGTLVFDDRGNVLSWIRKESTEQRKTRLLDYLAYLVAEGQIGIEGEEGSDRPVLASMEGNRLKLRYSASRFHRLSSISQGEEE